MYVYVLLLFNEISKVFIIFLLDELTYLTYLTSHWIVHFSGHVTH